VHGITMLPVFDALFGHYTWLLTVTKFGANTQSLGITPTSNF